ncbi:hypothetical protein D3C72_1570370 [compost metagenome]
MTRAVEALPGARLLTKLSGLASSLKLWPAMTESAVAGVSDAWKVISSAKLTPRKVMSLPSLLLGSNLPAPVASAVTSLPAASVITNWVLLVNARV